MEDAIARSMSSLQGHVERGDWETADRELQYLTGVFLRARLQGRNVDGFASALADLRMLVMTEHDVPQVVGPVQFGWMLASICSVAVQAGTGDASKPGERGPLPAIPAG